MRKACAMLFLFSMLTTTSADWLEGGYVGSPNYAEIRPYFTDPIFYIRVPASTGTAAGGSSFYREPIYLGKYAAASAATSTGSISVYPENAWQSEFRNRSLAMMEWDAFSKNWTSTMNYASTRSSLRVQDGGTWRSI